jgi:penicillin-binding protein 2
MTARLANGGKAVTPRLVRPERIDGKDDTPKFKKLAISRASLDVIRDGMNQVTNEHGGTAYRARISEKGMEMSGKTGTAQVRRISKAERETRVLKNHERPWRERDHALFVGYAPSDDPRYAVAVVVEHGGGGSKVAAPIARDLLLATQKRDPSNRETPPDAPRKPKSEEI